MSMLVQGIAGAIALKIPHRASRPADELEAVFRHLRRPFEPPPDRQLVVHQAHDVQGEAADC